MKFNDFEFTSKDDHSKWAVAASKESDWICVGDINRAVSISFVIWYLDIKKNVSFRVLHIGTSGRSRWWNCVPTFVDNI